MRVLLIAGGWSTEREVSLTGARKIDEALRALGHTVRFLDPALEFADIMAAAKDADFAFFNLHGAPGEDGLIQAMLEEAGCPYQGAGPKASFLSLNKAAAKALYTAAGLRTPAWRLFSGIPGEKHATDLPYPLFVKPNAGGSSLGMSRVDRPEDFPDALDTIFAMGDAAVVETAVDGVELTCAVLDDRPPLPVILIRPKAGTIYFDYHNKYAADGAEEICPAPIPESLAAEVQRMTLAAHKALRISGYSRSDFIADAEGKVSILETNTLPGMTPASLLPKAAAAAGMSFTELVAELIRLGLATHAKRAG